jgi:hypothetical protein
MQVIPPYALSQLSQHRRGLLRREALQLRTESAELLGLARV